MKMTFALCLVLLTTAACSDSVDTDGGLVADKAIAADTGKPATCGTSAYLPADGKIGDFKRTASPKAAANGKQLKDLIDGGSEKYEKNSFVCMSLVSYASATTSYKIEIWLFDQTDAAGAKAAYAATKHPDDADLSPTVGDASRQNSKLLFEYTADMIKGKYLARVKVDDKKGAADGLAAIKAVAANLP